MSSIATSLTVAPLIVPASMDSPDAHAFREFVRLDNAVCRHDAGHDFFDSDPAERLPSWQDDADIINRGFVAERDGQIVGVIALAIPSEPGATTLEYDLCVEPDLWGRGIEEALIEVMERTAREYGRTTVQTWTLHDRALEGELLPAPTGFGGIPARDRQTIFQLEQGFTFEQTERNSVFDLHGSYEVVERTLAESLAVAGEDYRVVEWTSPTPPEHAEGFAYAVSRMATDVPSGGMVWEEETWDAARIERRDARLLKGGHTVSVVCVQHVPTERIVAYNELTIGADHARATHQWGTLVLTEHRGHRLGTIVKCANLVRWHKLVPESPRVSTFNAEENRPMLDINEAIGFVPASYAGAWKKVLS